MSERPTPGQAPTVVVEPPGEATLADWMTLRRALWPHADDDAQRRELQSMLARPDRYRAFLARSDGRIAGFAEAAVRHDYVNGATRSPVVFLEGVYVCPESRRHGIGRALIDAVGDWAVGLGIPELASDVALDNRLSQAVHAKLGFEETGRVVFYHKRLDAAEDRT